MVGIQSDTGDTEGATRTALRRAVRANLARSETFIEPSAREAVARLAARQSASKDGAANPARLQGSPALWAAMGALAAAETMWAFPNVFGLSG